VPGGDVGAVRRGGLPIRTDEAGEVVLAAQDGVERNAGRDQLGDGHVEQAEACRLTIRARAIHEIGEKLNTWLKTGLPLVDALVGPPITKQPCAGIVPASCVSENVYDVRPEPKL